jgi:methionyl-tRNA formyltransferase
MTRLRLAFMGTPDFAVPCLDALVAAGHEIAAVYTQPPRQAGRQPRHVAGAAGGGTARLEVRTPLSLKVLASRPLAASELAAWSAYGLILPKRVLSAAARLPQHPCLAAAGWRGARRSSGDHGRRPETGVTIMQMDEGLNCRAMLREPSPLRPTKPPARSMTGWRHWRAADRGCAGRSGAGQVASDAATT